MMYGVFLLCAMGVSGVRVGAGQQGYDLPCAGAGQRGRALRPHQGKHGVMCCFPVMIYCCCAVISYCCFPSSFPTINRYCHHTLVFTVMIYYIYCVALLSPPRNVPKIGGGGGIPCRLVRSPLEFVRNNMIYEMPYSQLTYAIITAETTVHSNHQVE